MSDKEGRKEGTGSGGKQRQSKFDQMVNYDLSLNNT